MRLALRIAGDVLIAASLLGFVGLGMALLTREETAAAPAGLGFPALVHDVMGVGAPSPRSGVSFDRASAATSVVAEAPVRPITRLAIPSIDLDAEVVTANLVAVEGGVTWEVPAFKVGHAEGTAGAGQLGNAVMLGHVTSVHSGNVFQELERVHDADLVRVFSDADEFDYRVVSTAHVSRTDSSVLDPTQTPSVSLITCTGVWLPTIWDYTERLVVRAELTRQAP